MFTIHLPNEKPGIPEIPPPPKFKLKADKICKKKNKFHLKINLQFAFAFDWLPLLPNPPRPE